MSSRKRSSRTRGWPASGSRTPKIGAVSSVGAEHGQVDVPCDHQSERDAPDLNRPPDLLEQRQQLEIREDRRRLVLERLLLVEQAAHRRFFLSHRLCRSRSFFISDASGP